MEDIDEFSNAYMQKLPGVTIKELYTSDNSDAVFYLQSRGISKRIAQMMAALQKTYFVINMNTMTEVYEKFLKDNVKIVEHV